MTHAIVHALAMLGMILVSIVGICVAFTIIVSGIYGLKEGK